MQCHLVTIRIILKLAIEEDDHLGVAVFPTRETSRFLLPSVECNEISRNRQRSRLGILLVSRIAGRELVTVLESSIASDRQVLKEWQILETCILHCSPEEYHLEGVAVYALRNLIHITIWKTLQKYGSSST